jgi:fatty-acyl-CoA synthase
MDGLMQDWPLTVDRIIDHAGRWHGDREVVTRSVEGPLVRCGYGEIRRRAKRVSSLLQGWGIEAGDRIGVLAWNTHRHVEVWYGVMGLGAVCHTLNPRLSADQLVWMIDHAGDRILFADACFAPLVAQVAPRCPRLQRVVFLTDADHLAAEGLGGEDYEGLIADQSEDVAWGGFAENAACGLCYTSGTTGLPKGVLYSHRSNFLHTLVAMQSDFLGGGAVDTVLVAVPMFHANGWGLPFVIPGVGAKMVLPGPRLDGASIHALIEQEGVTHSAAVPTVWQMLLNHMEANDLGLTTLKRVLIGGAACPQSLIRTFHERYGVEVVHAWGMTELSPLGSTAAPSGAFAGASFEEQLPSKMKQGRPPLGVDLKIVDPQGARLPHDGVAFGALMAKGPFVVDHYFGVPEPVLDAEGFFDTGDIATIDRHGYLQIVDRAKDVIKSGGEWISSIEIECVIAGHPQVACAAVIGMPHPKWDERPLLIVQPKPGAEPTKADMLDWLSGKIPKWWMPDEVTFVERIQLGATGKVDKKVLRAELAASG